MSAITELQDYRDGWATAMEYVKAYLLGRVQKAPDAGTVNKGLEALHYAIASMDDHLRELNVAIAKLEAEEPGEDMRREHGTYFCSNGLRAG